MNHIGLRRFALTTASVSFGVLTAILLLWVAFDQNGQEVSAQTLTCYQAAEAKDEDISAGEKLPIPISCTALVIEELAAYDGNFIEDGTGREVYDIAAIMLRNSGQTIIPYAYVTVYTNNCRYEFDAFMIPPKSAVLVPDKNAQTLKETEITRAFGWTTVKQNKQKPEIWVEEISMGSLQVTNLSDQEIQDLTVYHRTYIQDGDFYMGGRAFKTEIPYIGPGEAITVYPQNYASGYSKVVCYD